MTHPESLITKIDTAKKDGISENPKLGVLNTMLGAISRITGQASEPTEENTPTKIESKSHTELPKNKPEEKTLRDANPTTRREWREKQKEAIAKLKSYTSNQFGPVATSKRFFGLILNIATFGKFFRAEEFNPAQLSEEIAEARREYQEVSEALNNL